MIAKVYTEFQPLEEAIVGKAYSADMVDHFKDPLRSMLQQIFDETEEDCLKVCDFLKEHGVTVKRPDIVFDLKTNKDQDGKYRPRVDLFKFGFSYPNQPLMPRDTIGVYGTTIVEFFTRNMGRYFDNWHFKNIMMEHFKQGNRWISMPQPILDPDAQSYTAYSEILFHAANILKCGKDLFYTLPQAATPKGKGTVDGLEWVKRELGNEFRFNPIPAGGHADGKIALVKPGLLMCWTPDHIPEKLKSWDYIQVPETWSKLPKEFRNAPKKRWFKDFVETYMVKWINYCDETIFDVNCFSVNENLVITNGYNKDVYAKLKKHGVEGHPIFIRHQHMWDGSHHCITLDTKRKGDQEDYFT